MVGVIDNGANECVVYAEQMRGGGQTYPGMQCVAITMIRVITVLISC
jgi:hypothetical protein